MSWRSWTVVREPAGVAPVELVGVPPALLGVPGLLVPGEAVAVPEAVNKQQAP